MSGFVKQVYAGGFLMKTGSIFIAFVVVFLFSGPNYSSSFDWNLEMEKNGIRVYLKELQTEDIKAFRGTISINASVDSLLAVIMDIDACTDWLQYCQNPLLLERINFSECYHYLIYNLPFPVVDREFILHTKIKRDHVSGAVTVYSISRPDYCLQQQTSDCQLNKDTSLVLVKHSQGSYLLEPVENGITKLTWTQYTNPGGYIPAWLVNQIIRQVAYHTLQGLRVKVIEKKYLKARLILDSDGAIIGMDRY